MVFLGLDPSTEWHTTMPDGSLLDLEQGPMWHKPGLPNTAHILHRANLPIGIDWDVVVFTG